PRGRSPTPRWSPMAPQRHCSSTSTANSSGGIGSTMPGCTAMGASMSRPDSPERCLQRRRRPLIARVDSALGRITTFRLIIATLTLLAALAIILGFAGLTVWPGPPQLASLAVLLVVGHLVNALIARL